MMKKIIITTLLISIFALTAVAQHNVILQSNGETTIFSTSDAYIDAYNAAENGDTIYLPGIQYNSPAEITKSITVFGTGYHPDNTEATGRTRISGFRFRDGSSGSHFEGMYVSGTIEFAGDLIEDVTLKRLHVNGDIEFNRISSDPCTECTNITIRECVFRDFNGIYSDITNLNLFNNISERINYIDNSNDGITNIALIANNIIIRDSYEALRYTYNSLIENNIFIRYGSWGILFSNYHGNTFKNNVLSENPTGNEENSWIDNYVNVDEEVLFMEFSESYSYESNYHLADPASYQGTTGNQVGIFGGLNPFKENTRPSNPQILSRDIESSTDEEGNLGFEIEVGAQDK